ncbi:extracellular solute-binding protein [Vibrio sp. SS-MA-C1-2]|uniref:extracellular solute-binding protein n=1 Tax=Vibrio sp. SS-MA-C1-2 TaxID=2908646 RepID=UPI0038FCFD2E
MTLLFLSSQVSAAEGTTEGSKTTVPTNNTLPSHLTWISNLNEPLFSSDKAKFGGVYRTFDTSFPQTFRTVGPDSNGSFRAWLTGGNLALVDMHPNNGKWLPALASSWAYGDDHKTVYFKLNPNAKWSDGKPVTAADFQFMLKFMRSKDIVAPWYNDFYRSELEEIIQFDPHTLAVVSSKPRNRDELMMFVNMTPRPAHFYANPKNDKNKDGIEDKYVRYYNFKAEPVTGPYYVSKIKKGKSIELKHVGQNWWGYENRYFQHRYNFERINIKIVRDRDIALKYFEKGQFDTFSMLFPSIWHEKAKGERYDKGYINKAWLYNQAPDGAGGVWMNTAQPLLNNIDLRQGVMHAIDIQTMIKTVLRGDYVQKPHGLGSGHGKYDNPNNHPPKFDPKLAAEYFVKAGFNKIDSDGIRINEKGQRLAFELTYLAKIHTPRVVVLREQAKLAGLDLQLKLVEGSTGFKYILEKKHQLALLGMNGGLIPAYWQYFHSANANKPQSNNFTNYSSPEMDKLIEQYRNEFDIDTKQNLSQQIQQLVTDAAVIVPGYGVPYSRAAYWRWVKLPEEPATKLSTTLFYEGGFSGTPSTFWFDEDEKRATLKAMDEGKSFPASLIIDKTYLNQEAL